MISFDQIHYFQIYKLIATSSDKEMIDQIIANPYIIQHSCVCSLLFFSIYGSSLDLIWIGIVF